MPTTEPQTNQSIVNAIVERLRVLRKGPCQHPHQRYESHAFPDKNYCPDCGGTGTITDPRYQAAWGLLHVWRGNIFGSSQWVEVREVDSWPDGAVRGLLEFDLLTALNFAASYDSEGGDCIAWLYQRGDGKRWLGRGRTKLEALGKALLEALNDTPIQ